MKTKEEIIQEYVEKVAKARGMTCEEVKGLKITQEYIKYVEAKEVIECPTQ